MNWINIPGWLTQAEGDQLQRLVQGRDVLELGAYCGRSTVCMADTALSVLSVDHFSGDDHTRAAGGISGCSLGHWLLNTVEYHNVDFIDSNVYAFFADEMYDVIYIDMLHNLETTKFCTELALSVLRPNGLIVWHDWDTFPGVEQGARAAFNFTQPERCESLAWVRV